MTINVVAPAINAMTLMFFQKWYQYVSSGNFNFEIGHYKKKSNLKIKFPPKMCG